MVRLASSLAALALVAGTVAACVPAAGPSGGLYGDRLNARPLRTGGPCPLIDIGTATDPRIVKDPACDTGD